MSVAVFYRRDPADSWINVTDLSLSVDDSAAVTASIADMELDYSTLNVAQEGQNILLHTYKDILGLVKGVNVYYMKVLQYTVDPLVDPTNEVDLLHEARVHQWAPGLLQVNPSI